MVSAAERKLGNADVGIWVGRKRGTEVVDIEGSGGYGDGKTSGLVDLACEC